MTPHSPDSASKLPLFFQRRFLPMWTALSLGAFTDNMLKQALSIALVYGVMTAPLISNDDALPIIGSLFPISMLLFSTIAGQFADKYETSMMFRRTKFIELILMIVAAIGFLAGNSGALILALFLMGAQSAFFSPARTGAMPKYLRPNELVRGNAFCSGGLLASVMLGVVIGGLLITQDNGPQIIAAILIIAALGGWLVVLCAPRAEANAPNLTIDWNLYRQGARLLGFLANAPGVIRPILGVSWYWTMGALVTVTLPLFTRDVIHGDETVVTSLMALFAIGAAIGSIGASLLSKKRTGLGFAATGAGASGLLILSIYFISTTYIAPHAGGIQNAGAFFSTLQGKAIATTFILASIAANIFFVPLQAAVQRRAPTERRARILAANNMINAAGAMIGSWLVLSVTRTSLDPSYIFLALGVAQTGLALYMMRRKATVKEGLYDEMLAPLAPQ